MPVRFRGLIPDVCVHLYSDTEIDWVAYMEEVAGFLGGNLDYSNLKGGTGPLVYPATFVYVYSVLYWITSSGTNILLGQYIFLGLYLVFLAVVFLIYQRTTRVLLAHHTLGLH